MKNKMLAIMLVVCVAMTATTFGHVWDGSELDGLWFTPLNWDEGTVPVSTTYIGNGDTVVLDYIAPSIGRLEIYGGSTLLIEAGTVIGQSTSQDTYLGGDGGGDHIGAGTIIQTGGSFTHGDDVKCNDGGAATYLMQGGSLYIPGYLETSSDDLFEFSGGSFICGVEDNEVVRANGVTFRVIGSWTAPATYTADERIKFSSINHANTYEFVPTADGEITPITSGNTPAGILVVDANDITATGIITMTLFTGGTVGTFSTVTITKDGTTLTEGTGVGQYTIDYTGGTGNDVVLSVNLPDPANVACDAAKSGGYTEEMARLKGDTNYDCKVDELDLAAMALEWMTVKSL